MSLHNGTAYETEFKRMLEQSGRYVLNLGQNESGDLISFYEGIYTVHEVKSQMNGQMRFDFDSPKLRVQWGNLAMTANYVNVEYDFRTKGKQWHVRQVSANEPCPKSIRIDMLPTVSFQDALQTTQITPKTIERDIEADRVEKRTCKFL
jgi:Holliday junction resolvase